MGGGAWWAAVHGVAKSRTQLSNFTFTFSLSCIGEGNGNPLQCSCLENPRGRRAWRADVYGVTQSRTRLKWLGSKSILYIYKKEKLVSLLLPTLTVLPKELCSEILKVNRWHQQNENDETVHWSTFWHREKDLQSLRAAWSQSKETDSLGGTRVPLPAKRKSQAATPCETDRQCAPASHWSIRTLERGTVFSPVSQRGEGGKSYYHRVFGGKEQGWICVCVCVCVCTCTHWHTIKLLHRHRLIICTT